jgi:NADPH:quinone reductase-like Zn-dependent oxidoreductase
MKALVYEKAHGLEEFAIKLTEIPEPTHREFDVLVDVHAVGINPGETFIRRTRSAEPGGRVLLGWEFAGVIVEAGSGVRGFKTGDRVFGTGDMTRDGAWAERCHS